MLCFFQNKWFVLESPSLITPRSTWTPPHGCSVVIAQLQRPVQSASSCVQEQHGHVRAHLVFTVYICRRSSLCTKEPGEVHHASCRLHAARRTMCTAHCMKIPNELPKSISRSGKYHMLKVLLLPAFAPPGKYNPRVQSHLVASRFLPELQRSHDERRTLT